VQSTELVTGDAPQPGETPRNESERWSVPDPNTAWWQVEKERDEAEALAEAAAARPRHPRRRPASTTPASAQVPPFAPEALDAHAAGVHDVSGALEPAVEATPPPEPKERDHDRRPRDRYEPPADEPDTPAEDVMVLPERPVPGQAAAGRSRLSEAAVEARRERMENHPFWLSEDERATAVDEWPPARTAQGEDDEADPVDEERGRPPKKKARGTRGPVAGLVGLVTMALVAAFFSWVSAEPFWLAVGHGDRGVATVGRCSGAGVTQRCHGSFAAADGAYAVERLTLLGVDGASRTAGSLVPARMVSPDSRQAYIGRTGWMLHLRWALGFVLVLLCGYGIAGMTGARLLETGRARRSAVLISLAGPVILLCGFLAAAY